MRISDLSSDVCSSDLATAAQKFNQAVNKSTTDSAIEKASAFDDADDARLIEVGGILSAGTSAAADMSSLVTWVETITAECATAETSLSDAALAADRKSTRLNSSH